jgi:hypothetical protein
MLNTSAYSQYESRMRAITVEARSFESARALQDALSEFHAKLIGTEDEGYRVSIELGAESQIIAVLDALEQHVAERHDGPARVELDGRRYTMHADTRDVGHDEPTLAD